MKHCLAQVFSVGLPTRLPKRDFVGCPVVLQNQWMDHGDICSALFKVAYPDSPAWTSHRQAVGRLPLPHRRGHRRNAPGFCARTPRSAHESPDVSGRTWKASTRSVRFSSPASACRRPPPSCTARVYSSPPNRARSFSVRRFRRNSSAAMESSPPMGPSESPTGHSENQEAGRRKRLARRPRMRRCLLKGCEQRFHPRQAHQRYCSESCRAHPALPDREASSRRHFRALATSRSCGLLPDGRTPRNAFARLVPFQMPVPLLTKCRCGRDKRRAGAGGSAFWPKKHCLMLRRVQLEHHAET